MKFFSVILLYIFYIIIPLDANEQIQLNEKNILCDFKLFNFFGIPQITLLDTLVDDSESGFQNEFIRTCGLDQALVIIKVDNLDILRPPFDLGDLPYRLTNYVLFINTFSIEKLPRHFLPSKWSLLFIIIDIKDDQFQCENGKFEEKSLLQIEWFLNSVWHRDQMMFALLWMPYTCSDYVITFNSTKYTAAPLYNRTITVVYKDDIYTSISEQSRSSHKLSTNFPLKANIFPRFPTSIQTCANLDNYMVTNLEYSGGYCGLDGIILGEAVKLFGFNMSVVGEQSFGYMDAAGTPSGSLKDVVEGVADVSFASRFQLPFRNVDFLFFVWTDCICAIVKRPKERPVWYFPYEAFKLRVWFVILGTLTCAGVFSWVKSIVVSKRPGMKVCERSSLLYYILDAVTTGLFGFILIKRVTCILMKVTCLLGSIILAATYQGHVNFVFTTLTHFDPVDSQLELYRQGYTIYTSPGVKTLIEPPVNEVQDLLLKNRLITSNEDDGFQSVLRNKKAATLRRKSDFVLESRMSYLDEDSEFLFRVVEESFRCQYLSYISTDGFLFEDHLRLFMARMVEAGLPSMYYKWTYNSLGLGDAVSSPSTKPRPVAKVELTDLRIVFGLLFAGQALAVCAFMLEVYCHKRGVKWL